MMIQWISKFDDAQMLWLLLSSVLLLVTLLPACVFLFTRELRFQNSLMTPANWFGFAIMHTTAWVLILFSLAFGPSLGTIPQGSDSAAPMGTMEDMIREASQTVDQRHLFGRGGIIGNLDFAGFRNLEVQGNPDEPYFASRRPHHSVSLVAYLGLQLCIYLCAVLTVIAVASTRGTTPARILIFSLLWGSLVYAPAMHWVWGQGWLGIRGAIDIGGSLFIVLVGASVLAIWQGSSTDPEPTVPPNGAVFHLAAALFLLGYLVLMSSLSVAGTQLRAISFLNGTVAACGGFLFFYLIQMLTPSRAVRNSPAVGSCCGIISVAAGCTILDSQAAFTCGVFGGAAGFVAWASALRFKCNQPLEFPVATTAAAITGVLMIGFCGSSSHGVFDWNGAPITSLMHGEVGQIKIQALTAISIVAFVFAMTKLLGKTCLKPSEDARIAKN